MKALIKKVERFTIEINGVEYHDFEKVDKWNDMVCFQNKQGKVIIQGEYDDGFAFLNEALKPKEDSGVESDIVSCTPFFIGEAK